MLAYDWEALWGEVMQVLLGLVVFVIVVVLGLLGLQAGGALPQAIIILLSAAVGLAVWKAQENAKQTQALEAQLAADKKVLYKLYLDVMREVVEKGAKADSAGSVIKLRKWVFGALLIASDEVVLAHNRFLNAGRIGDGMQVPAIADVILAMRRDTGEELTGLRPIDILATFIKAEDIDAMRPLCDEWARQRTTAWPKAKGHSSAG